MGLQLSTEQGFTWVSTFHAKQDLPYTY